jgi:hypothetical protein
MKNIKYFLVAFFIFFNFSAMAGELTGKIVKIMTLPSVYATYNSTAESFTMLYVEGLPNACNESSGQARVAIGTKHTAHNSVLALALSAHATGNDVTIKYLGSCNVKSNSWDFSYMFLNEKKL